MFLLSLCAFLFCARVALIPLQNRQIDPTYCVCVCVHRLTKEKNNKNVTNDDAKRTTKMELKMERGEEEEEEEELETRGAIMRQLLAVHDNNRSLLFDDGDVSMYGSFK